MALNVTSAMAGAAIDGDENGGGIGVGPAEGLFTGECLRTNAALAHFAQRHAHRRAPVHAVIRPLVQRGHAPAVVAEGARGPRVFAAPGPRALAERQVLVADVSLGVEEMRSVPLGFRVVAD